VQIGTVSDIAKAVPANFTNANKPIGIAPASGNGNAAPKSKETAAEAVAGD
jgi:hypothetical protein